jgi:hypothetical protein
MIKRKTKLAIDSRDRNVDIYPSPNNYVLKLNTVIKNITSVKLIHALYHKQINEYYVNLQIDEFSPNAISNNRYIQDAFTQLPMKEDFNEYRCDPHSDDVSSSGKLFEQPLAKLTKLSIRFLDYKGDVVNLVGEHFLKFEIQYFVHNETIELDPSGIKFLNEFFEEDTKNDRLYNQKNGPSLNNYESFVEDEEL